MSIAFAPTWILSLCLTSALGQSPTAQTPQTQGYLGAIIAACARADCTAEQRMGRVMRVDPRSPAAAAGLQVGDTVEAINGQELTQVPLPELLRYKAGEVVALRIRRSGKSLVVRAKTVPRTPELEARLGARPPSKRP